MSKGRRTQSSQRWLQRWLKDPYVLRARKEGWRARSAFKLLEIEEKHKILKGKRRILELGSAPGGWTEVVRHITPTSFIVAVDRLEMDPIEGALCLQADLSSEEGWDKVRSALSDQKADVVLSDAAPNTIGHASTDHIRMMVLVEKIWQCSQSFLDDGGVFVCKGWQGHEWSVFVKSLQKYFIKTSLMKPPSSQKESREVFFIGQGYHVAERL